MKEVSQYLEIMKNYIKKRSGITLDTLSISDEGEGNMCLSSLAYLPYYDEAIWIEFPFNLDEYENVEEKVLTRVILDDLMLHIATAEAEVLLDLGSAKLH
ncbi:hypothetical protein NVP1121O_227 [Vibrio phage 1.121.O._10N.286.46.C4]|nr:hypothetical protein NVP1121O_227 [Vibrio phage 1.121.O._10N.286.46.C4]